MTESISEAFTSYATTPRELAPEEGTLEPDPIIAATGEDQEAELPVEDTVDETEPEAEPEAPADDESDDEDEVTE